MATFDGVSVGSGTNGSSGMLNVSGGTLTVAGLVGVNTDGTLDVSDGASFSADRVSLSMGGSVCGTGTIQANLENESGGVVRPGHSAGILTVDGSYIQKSGATLEIELGGLIRGDEYDTLVVLGNADFHGGDLDVVLINGFMPSAGDSFDILDWGTLSDMSFNNVNLPDLSFGYSWDASELASRGRISVTPPADTDGDGIPDAWEEMHFGGPTNANAAAMASNAVNTLLETYIADLDPHDPASLFCITAISNGPPTVFFEASSNRLYTLIGCSDLLDAVWTNVPGGGPRAGAGGADSMTVTNQPSPDPFYRRQVTLP